MGRLLSRSYSHREELRRQISELEKATVDLTSLQDRIAPLKKELQNIGKELSTKRQAAAKRLNPAIEKELAELGMEKAKFTIVLTPAAEPLASGLDQIEFIAQTNPGQLAQPLRKIASGGELSRVMLALKGILAQGDRVSVLVFDEIDANVGGRLGSIIGSKLRKLATRHQVLCITHLPQIASFADRHLTVRKEVANGSAAASVRTVDGDERIEELAEMISGQRVTDTTRRHANFSASRPAKQPSTSKSPHRFAPRLAGAPNLSGNNRGFLQ